jgi:hypothetical protein
MFERFQISYIEDSVSVNSIPMEDLEGAEDDDAVYQAASCEDKAPDGNQKVQACWGWRQTHNEQLLVNPCGVIVAHKTFSIQNQSLRPKSVYFCFNDFITDIHIRSSSKRCIQLLKTFLMYNSMTTTAVCRNT